MTTHTKFDIHQHITNQLVAAIERGTGAFTLPWHRAGRVSRPTNVASGKPYQGVNVIALWESALAQNFTSGRWGTYRQWAALGAQVRKREKATYIVFYAERASDDEDETAPRVIVRATPVFAAEQVEGYEPPPVPELPETARIAAAEAFVRQTGAVLAHDGDVRAFYRPSTDDIHLPPFSSFTGTRTISAAESYYATVFHELTHWTAPAHRLGRDLSGRFGDEAYAAEELVASLGAAFLCADLGIADAPRADHAQYIASWLAVLKNDKRAIFTAASKASAAVAYLRSRAA